MPKKVMGTDNATFAIFDRQAMRHRLEDYCDWWSLPQKRVGEINAGKRSVHYCGLFVEVPRGTGLERNAERSCRPA